MQHSFSAAALRSSKKLLFFLSILFLSACSTTPDESSPASPENAAETTGLNEEESTPEETVLETEVESTENSTEPEAAAETEAETTSVTPAEPIQPVLGGSAGGIIPVTLSIPAIDVEGPVLPVGLEEDGAMEVPETGDDIGWFERGVKPGAQGNAVLAGHVDDLTGPAIFFDLEKLEAGDEITVTSADGESLTFVVTHKEAYPYQDAPIDEVFGATSSRRLNLITCTGEFDRDAGTHRERLVVFTELKQE